MFWIAKDATTNSWVHEDSDLTSRMPRWFIDLPSIFRDNNVISAMPSYFENTEYPIICYKYYKPIPNTILSFNELVSDLDIETSSPDS